MFNNVIGITSSCMNSITWATHVLQWLLQLVTLMQVFVNLKSNLSSDYFLKLENMKVESLVIINKYVMVNIHPTLVHTARHVTGINCILSYLFLLIFDFY